MKRSLAINVTYSCKGCGDKYPLCDMFWSEGRNNLLCRRNNTKCTRVELEAYYDPWLMENLPTQEANAFRHQSSQIFCCPLCTQPLKPTVNDDDGITFFQCQYCGWDSTSLEKGTYWIDSTDDDSEQELISSAICAERDCPQHSLFEALVAFAKKPKEFIKPTSNNRGQWNVAMLEELLIAKQVELSPQKVLDNDLEIQQTLESIQPGGYSYTTSSEGTATSLLVPTRLPLRSKKSYRCIESLSKKAAGILVKPHINPMSGDSSVRGMTSWFKKATLAIDFVPMFRLVSLPQIKEDLLEYQVVITNPLDSKVKLTFAALTNQNLLQVVESNFVPIVLNAAEDINLLQSFQDDDTTSTSSNSVPELGELNADSFIVEVFENSTTIRLQAPIPESKKNLKSALQVSVQVLEEDDLSCIESSEFEFQVEFGLGDL